MGNAREEWRRFMGSSPALMRQQLVVTSGAVAEWLCFEVALHVVVVNRGHETNSSCLVELSEALTKVEGWWLRTWLASSVA